MTVPRLLDLASWLLAAAAWAAWALLGNGRWGTERGDRLADAGTLVWGMATLVGSIVAGVAIAAALPWAGLPVPPWAARMLGAVVALVGVALREWAVMTLGPLFTQVLMIREGHRVVTSGPYRVLRHPGYAGTLVTVAGLAITLGNWASLALVVLGFFVSHLPRIRREERVLEDSLGKPYREFERTRKRIIPGVW